MTPKLEPRQLQSWLQNAERRTARYDGGGDVITIPSHSSRGMLGGVPGNDGNDVVGADAGDLRGSNNGVEDLGWVFVVWAIPSRLPWGVLRGFAGNDGSNLSVALTGKL